MKQRNPSWGCPRIAQQIALAFGILINKDVVRRILAGHNQPPSGSGPSWLTFLGHMKDSLWSVDAFRCESYEIRGHVNANREIPALTDGVTYLGFLTLEMKMLRAD
jgi:hypothetical protein